MFDGFFFKHNFIHLSISGCLDLCSCEGFSPVVVSGGGSLLAALGLPVVVASLVLEQELQGAWPQSGFALTGL